jgi:hypothetical protein
MKKSAALIVAVFTALNLSLTASADTQKFTVQSVAEYIGTESGQSQIADVISDTLENFCNYYDIDSVTVGSPAEFYSYAEDTKSVQRQNLSVYSGVYYGGGIIGVIRFYCKASYKKDYSPYCYEFMPVSADTVKDAESIVLFSAYTDDSSGSAGNAGEKYLITDTNKTSLLYSYYRLDERFFAQGHTKEVTFDLFPESVRIPVKNDSGTEIAVNYTAPKTYRIKNKDGSYITLSGKTYTVSEKSDDASQLFTISSSENGTISLVNCKSGFAVRSRGTSEFTVKILSCSDYYDDNWDSVGMMTSISYDANGKSYALTVKDGRVCTSKLKEDLGQPAENQTWYLEKA